MDKKHRYKLLIITILLIVLFSATTYAAILYSANIVYYNNSNGSLTSTNVQGAIDELATRYANIECPNGKYCIDKFPSYMPDNVPDSYGAVMDNVKSTYATSETGIDFSKISSGTNGKGLYIFSPTAYDTHPIYYYRGAVDNNNVNFANFCWKIVRTTDTGGIKLIYNGPLKEIYDSTPLPDSSFTVTNDATYPFTYDSSNKTWTSTMKDHSKSAEITFAIKTAGDYSINYTVSSESGWDKAHFYKNGTEIKNDSGTVTGQIPLNGLTTSDTIKVKYQKDGGTSSNNDNVIFSIGLKGEVTGTTCNNTGDDSQISTSTFNNVYSPAAVGYMYGTRYTYSNKSSSSLATSYKYGNSFTYSGGTYTLKDTIDSSGTWSNDYKSLNNNHYTCFNTTGTCNSLYYIYFSNATYAYYITLTSGKSVENALDEMLTSSSNTTNSTIKGVLDTWYQNILSSYSTYFEDTVWCNDRSISSLNGWNPNGGDTTKYLYFSAYERAYTTHSPSLSCRENDSFTVSNSNGNGKLTYPVGLLTADEIMIAGGNTGSSNSSYYLYTGNEYWAGSPYYSISNGADEFIVLSSGNFSGIYVSSTSGVRPSISLKSDTKFTTGDGSYTNPFKIEN